jgi:hypothetical protein
MAANIISPSILSSFCFMDLEWDPLNAALTEIGIVEEGAVVNEIYFSN